MQSKVLKQVMEDYYNLIKQEKYSSYQTRCWVAKVFEINKPITYDVWWQLARTDTVDTEEEAISILINKFEEVIKEQLKFINSCIEDRGNDYEIPSLDIIRYTKEKYNV